MHFAKCGGTLDITAAPGENPVFGMPTRKALKFLLDRGVSPKQITLSSDGNGSMPRFDNNGKLVGQGIGPITAVLESVVELWNDAEFDAEAILAMATSNVADHLALNGKGRIAKGADADFLALDKNGVLRHVTAMGTLMMRDGLLLKKGTFE